MKHPGSVRTVVFATDFSPASAAALEQAFRLAARFGAALHVVHVLEYGEKHAAATAQLDAILGGRRPGGGEVRRALEEGEAPAPTIVAYAEAHGADLLVVGTHGRRRLERLFMGSVAEEVIREAPCPVLAVRRQGEAGRPLRRVLVPVDLSERSEAVVRAAVHWAGPSASLDLLHVLETVRVPGIYGALDNPLDEVVPEVEARVRDELRRLAAAAGAPADAATAHFREGTVAAEILGFAEQHAVDLIVLGAQGLTGLERFVLGSVTEKVMRQAPCPVLVVKVPRT